MNKKIWLSVFGLVILMFPAVVGAVTCYDGNGGLYPGGCPIYVDVTEMGSTTSTTIVGTWHWVNGNNYDFSADGKFSKGGVQTGTWALTNSGLKQYTVSWSAGWVDVVNLVSNGTLLDGYNQYGDHITATRVGSAHSPCMASFEDILLNIPNLKYSVTMLGNQYFAVDFVYDPFILTATSDIYFVLTDYSIVSPLSCTDKSTPILNPNLDIYIPDVMLPGGTHVWVGLKYDPAISSFMNEDYFYVYLFAVP